MTPRETAVFTQSEVEWTTAGTDALLALLCLVLAIQLMVTPTRAAWKRNVWIGVLILMSCGSILGAIAHGLRLADATRAAIWKPLYLTLSLAVALVVVVAIYDWRGTAAARRFLPWALGAGLLFFGATHENAFVTTSICMASRASIFTGQYMSRHGIAAFSVPIGEPAWTTTYPAILRRARVLGRVRW